MLSKLEMECAKQITDGKFKNLSTILRMLGLNKNFFYYYRTGMKPSIGIALKFGKLLNKPIEELFSDRW